jgi:hypothetical protein
MPVLVVQMPSEPSVSRFYTALLAVPGWPALPLTQAAQAVQRSAYPQAYARWEADAQTLAQTLTGRGDLPPAAGCPPPPPPARTAEPGRPPAAAPPAVNPRPDRP